MLNLLIVKTNANIFFKERDEQKSHMMDLLLVVSFPATSGMKTSMYKVLPTELRHQGMLLGLEFSS